MKTSAAPKIEAHSDARVLMQATETLGQRGGVGGTADHDGRRAREPDHALGFRLVPERGECPELDVALLSSAGSTHANEDYVAAALGTVSERAVRGSVIAIADGMSGSTGGRVAAELAVRGFLDAYSGLPETIAPDLAAHRALDSIHRWIYQIGRTDESLKLMAASFGALIIRGSTAFWVAVGDVRLYLLRDGQLLQCGDDDVLQVAFGDYVSQAVGLHAALVTRVETTDLRENDRLLLCTDGLHRRVPGRTLQGTLDLREAPSALVSRLIRLARAQGSVDDVSVVVADVKSTPVLDFGYLERVVGKLPIPAVPSPGDRVDGYELTSILSDGYYSRIFLGHDQADPRKRLALKFPKPRVEHDDNIRQSIVRERWLAGKIGDQNILAPQAIDAARQTRLYVVMPYCDGLTLETLIVPTPVSLTWGLDIARQLGRAIDALNRRQIFHRDIKPENVLVMPNGSVKLLDLGFAYLPGLLAPGPDTAPGTPAYMAPELMRGAQGDTRSEVFAFGVTLYRTFSAGRLPYGFDGRIPLHHHRPDLPRWLDVVLEKAIHSDPARRYQDVLEVCTDLERFSRNAEEAPMPQLRPMIERSPLTFWKTVSFVLFVMLLLALAHLYT